MNFLTTLPWYVIVSVIVLVMFMLFHIYKTPKEAEPEKPEVLPDEEQVMDFQDISGHTNALFIERIELLFQEFRDKKHTASQLFDLVIQAYLTTTGHNESLRIGNPERLQRVQYISFTMLQAFNDFQLQEISLKLIKFCEDELKVYGLNDEAFRHRSQVTQSIRLLEMARAILVYLASLRRNTYPSNFVRQFNHIVVQTLYAKAMSDVVNAKKKNKNLAQSKFHRHNREQRAKRLQRQARDRPKTN